MSMISAQCDRLRDAANALQEIIDDFNKGNRGFTYSGIVSTLHYAINGLRSAADTIWELRNKLSDMVDCRERARELEGENQTLRELCANLWPVAKSGVCIDRCKLYDTCMPNYDENGCILKRQLRELGILTCSNCKRCEAHGYPPKGIEKTAFTVSLWCSETGESTDPYDSCDKHQIGGPRIVRDDVDGF